MSDPSTVALILKSKSDSSTSFELIVTSPSKTPSFVGLNLTDITNTESTFTFADLAEMISKPAD